MWKSCLQVGLCRPCVTSGLRPSKREHLQKVSATSNDSGDAVEGYDLSAKLKNLIEAVQGIFAVDSNKHQVKASRAGLIRRCTHHVYRCLSQGIAKFFAGVSSRDCMLYLSAWKPATPILQNSLSRLPLS